MWEAIRTAARICECGHPEANHTDFRPTHFPDLQTRDGFYQSYAPMNALMSGRTTAQLVRDCEELELLNQKWLAKGNVRIEEAEFAFAGKGAPMSWELTQQEDEIQRQWETTLRDPSNGNLQAVRSFCGLHASQPRGANVVPAIPRARDKAVR
jgi:hypothetical protein